MVLRRIRRTERQQGELNMNTHSNVRKLTELAILTAITVVLQFLGSAIRVGPFSVSLTLIPIIVGAVLHGPMAGAWLGLVFGTVVILSGDAAAFLAVNVPGTVVTCSVRGLLTGYTAGWVYHLGKKVSPVFGTFAAAVVSPVVNTGLFLVCCFLFFYDTVAGWGAAMGFSNAALYMVTAFVGVNFIVELAINIVLAPTIVRLLNYIRKPAEKENKNDSGD